MSEMEADNSIEIELLREFDYEAALASNVATIALPSPLEQILERIARTGSIDYAWSDLQRLFRLKLMMVIEQYFQKYGFTGPVTDTYETRKHELLEFFEAHDDRAPFTIQRFAELLQDCSKQYSKTHKLMNALERLLMVTSSYDDNFS